MTKYKMINVWEDDIKEFENIRVELSRQLNEPLTMCEAFNLMLKVTKANIEGVGHEKTR